MEHIDPRHLLIKVVEVLEELKIPYAITGGMAVFVWAKPRFTADIDIIILLDLQDVEKLSDALLKISEYGYLDKDDMWNALRRHGEFNFIDGASGVKVDFWVLGGDSFGKDQIKRRTPKEVLNKKVFFVSPEDLILSKLLWAKESESEFQLRDVESVLKIQKKLDWVYLKKWAKKQSTFEILSEVKKKSKNE